MRIKDTSGEVLQKVSGTESNSVKTVETKAVEPGISQIKDDGFELAKAVESINQNQSKESEGSRKKTGLTGGLKLKVASEAMRPADAAIKNRDLGSIKTSEQKGSKDLSFDQAVLAGNANFDLNRSTYEIIDGKANYENQKDKKKPGGSFDSKKDTQQELNSQRGLQGSPEQSGATGPDVSEVVNQLASGDFSIPPRESSEVIPGIKEQPRTKEELREGASGNALLNSANEHDQKGPSYGKGMIADGTVLNAAAGASTAISAGVPGIPFAVDAAIATEVAAAEAASHSAGVLQAFGTAAEAAEATAAASEATAAAAAAQGAATLTAVGGVAVAAVVGAAIGTGIDKLYEAVSGQSLGEDIADATSGTDTKEETEAKAEEGRKQGAEKKAKKEAAQSGQSTEAQSTEGQSTEDGNTTKDPGGYEDYEGNIPDFIKQQGQKFVNDLRAIGPHKGGEDVDPAEESEPKGQIVNDAQVHLAELGKFGLFGQPDTTQQLGGGGTFTNSPQSGGDVDFGPDSPNHGYAGPTRGGDPTDVNLNVGATPIIGLRSKNKEEDKSSKKKK